MHDISKTEDDHLHWQVAELWKVGVLCGEGVELATGVNRQVSGKEGAGTCFALAVMSMGCVSISSHT